MTYRHEASGRGIEAVDLDLQNGSFTVITGRIGFGKTTLLRALLGLLPKQAGETKWNGRLVTAPEDFFIPPRAAYTAQVPRLFSDSLRHNLLHGLPEENVNLEAAIHAAVMEQDIAELEAGLDTIVGPKGVKLSGGQIQRSATARMFARDAELYVFDDLSSYGKVRCNRISIGWRSAYKNPEIGKSIFNSSSSPLHLDILSFITCLPPCLHCTWYPEKYNILMREAVDTTVKTLKRNLGGQLEAIYLFGSLAQGHYIPDESDINLYAVISEGTTMHVVRTAFLTAWEECGNVLKRAPYVATKPAFFRHIKLNPLLAQHLIRDSEQLFGSPDFLDESLAKIDPHEGYASLVTEARQVSTLLAPRLMKEDEVKATEKRMRRLARKLRNEPLPEGETAVQSYARIQHFLNPIMARLPATKKWSNVVPGGGTTPLLPGLQTIYNEAGVAILVFNRLTPQQIIQTDWEKLAGRLPTGTKGLQITTVEQMGLSIMFERPLDLRFKKIQHTWGPDFLAAFNPSNRLIMRYSARVPSRILIEELPNVYFTKEDSEESLHEIIHDFQNKMLNIGLEHELLVRFGLSERFIPPMPVPGRETPPQQRIAALFQHLEWWTDFYATQL